MRILKHILSGKPLQSGVVKVTEIGMVTRILFAVLNLVALRLLACSWPNTSGCWQVSYATVLCKWIG